MGGVTSDIADSLRAHMDKVHADRVKAQHDARQLRGSVTERLSARVEALEATVGRLLANEAKLIADSVRLETAMDYEVKRTRKLEHEQRGYVDAEDRKLRTQQGATFNSLAEFCGRSLWQRLRWLALGK